MKWLFIVLVSASSLAWMPHLLPRTPPGPTPEPPSPRRSNDSLEDLHGFWRADIHETGQRYWLRVKPHCVGWTPNLASEPPSELHGLPGERVTIFIPDGRGYVPDPTRHLASLSRIRDAFVLQWLRCSTGSSTWSECQVFSFVRRNVDEFDLCALRHVARRTGRRDGSAQPWTRTLSGTLRRWRPSQ